MKRLCQLPLLPAAVILLLTGCTAKKAAEPTPSGRFMEHDPARTPGRTFTEIIQTEREKKELRRLEFQDVRRPMNQDSIRVFPWRKSYEPRSEKLHEASREGANSLF